MNGISAKPTPKMNAGGRATEAGMDFQAEVGAWLAAHLLARTPIGGRFGMANLALPVSIQLETGEGLDDVLLIQDDGGRVEIQAKTKASLSTGSTSPLGKTIMQLVRTVADAKVAGVAFDVAKTRAVLAVTAAAHRTLDDLEKGCRAFDLGGAWNSTKAQRSKSERSALDLFEDHARTAWAAHTTLAIDDSDLVAMARVFRIVRFSMDEGDDNWREAARLLGVRLFGSEGAGDAPLRELKAIIRDMIGRGALADRDGLLRALRTRGHHDVVAADYQTDLSRLVAATDAELTRLVWHTKLPVDGGIPVARDSDPPLSAAVATGSLVVVGEPGAGKTGALVSLAQARRAAGDTVVFLSVDRFPGVSVATDLQTELRLEHPVTEVLSAAPGAGNKLLIIDALDAARGGPAEGVFAQLIERLSATSGTSWTIVVSIRTFDLKNGRRIREAIPGSPPDLDFAESSLGNVRHFLVPRLTEADLHRASIGAVELGDLLSAAPVKLRHLLRNVFNLSLAAQLLADGVSPANIRTAATQSDLIDAYEDRRLPATTAQQAASSVIGAMVRRRRLTVRKVVVGNERLDELIQSGVLIEAGDLVSFSHHVLFDHVAGRFYLEWDDPTQLIEQLSGDSSVALMLAPGVRFAVERLWRSLGDGKAAAWGLIVDIYANATVDPVLANVALRTAIECVESASDVAGLTQFICARAGEDAITTMLSRLARFVGLAANSGGSIIASNAVAWANVAEACIVTGRRELSDPTRFLLQTLLDKADCSDLNLLEPFGRASRMLLTLAWDSGSVMQQTAVSGIRFVGRSFASDPLASRTLLDRVLRDPHFSAHADREATWLAEQILTIAQADPDFAVEIFRVLYSQEITDDAVSYLGGQPSRIMPLSSNRRQDYRSCRYNLGRRSGQLLGLSASIGTRIVNEATLGSIDRATAIGENRQRLIIPGRPPFDLLGHEHAYNAWEEPDEDHVTQADDILANYVHFLRTAECSEYARSIETAASGYVSPALWARLLGVGAERVVELGELLWPFATNVTMLAHEDIVRDAVRFLSAAYPLRSESQRAAFETEALRPNLFDDERKQIWWQHCMVRLLSLVDETQLVVAETRALRAQLSAGGALRGNPPLRTMSTSWEPSNDITRTLMAREGVNVHDGVDAKMLAQSDALNELVQATPSESDAAALVALWTETLATVALYDAHVTELNENVEHPVWGHISNAVERIVGSNEFEPGANGLPDIPAVWELLVRLWKSRFPEPVKPDEDGSLGWGNWAVRVYAAQAFVAIAARFGEAHGDAVAKFDEILRDPVPQVRLQAAHNLLAVWHIAPDLVWTLAERLARQEPHGEVLASFLNAVLSRLTWYDPQRCEEIIEIIRARSEASEIRRRSSHDQVASSLGGLTAQLWVWQARPKALEWLVDWAAEPTAHSEILTSFLSKLRGAFFTRYALGNDTDPLLADRAQQGATAILEACSAIAAHSHRAVTIEGLKGADLDAAVATYQATETVIGHLMNQLYFGSGAYADSKETVGLSSPGAMQRFLIDYRTILELLGNSHEPSTHHHLIELYEYLIPGDPADVFDAICSLLLGAGARQGYHYESIASAVIVNMITRYLSDYRSIFEDDSRRERLIAILRLFSDIGWTDALKLLYDLPDLLR